MAARLQGVRELSINIGHKKALRCGSNKITQTQL
jgi:hypothetical protein